MSTAEGPGERQSQPAVVPPPMPPAPPQQPPAAPAAAGGGPPGFGPPPASVPQQPGGGPQQAPFPGSPPQGAPGPYAPPPGAPPMQGGGPPVPQPQQYPPGAQPPPGYAGPGAPAGPPGPGSPGGAPAGWPTYAPQNPGMPRQRKGRGRGWLIVFLVVVVIVGAVGGTAAWWALGWGKGRALWTLEYPGQPDTQNYLTTWTTDEYIVRAHPESVLGLDPASGSQKWEVPVPGAPENVVCASSSVSSEGVVVLAYGKVGYCTNVFAVDMKQGEMLWDKPRKDDTQKVPNLAVSNGTVVVANQTAYRMRDGSQLWKNSELEGGKGCTPGIYGGGARLVRTQACEMQEGDLGDVISVAHTTSEIDSQTGEVLWTYRAEERNEEPPYDPADGAILSTSPVVVRETADQFRILSDDGEPRGLVDIKGTNGMGQGLLVMPGSPRPALTASGDVLVVEQKGNGDATFEEVMAFDMATGEQLWSSGPSDKVRYNIVQGDDDRLLAVKHDFDTISPNSSKRPFSLVEFDPATGEETEVQDYEGVGLDLGGREVPYLYGDKLILMSIGTDGTVGEFAGEGLNGDRHDLSLVVLET